MDDPESFLENEDDGGFTSEYDMEQETHISQLSMMVIEKTVDVFFEESYEFIQLYSQVVMSGEEKVSE